MSIEIQDVSDLSQYSNLGNLTMNTLLVLPNNFNTEEKEFCYTSTLPTFKKLAKNSNLDLFIIGDTENKKLLEQRGGEWFAPILLIGSLFYTQNPEAISIALGMISNYLSSLFIGKEDGEADMTIYVRDDERKVTKKVHYKGPVNGLLTIKDTVKKIFSERSKTNR